MNSNSNYHSRSGRSGDHNHWYSSTYWRSNRQKLNNCNLPQNTEKVMALSGLNIVQDDKYSSAQNLRSYAEPNSRLNSKSSVKRSNDCFEHSANQKRLRIMDPFESPNSLVKDFRLTDSRDSVDLRNLFCEMCQTQCKTSLDYSNHLSGRRHKINMESVNGYKQTDDRNKFMDRLNRLLKHSKESVVGLDYIKEERKDFFTCKLCKCYEMTASNTFQHINGFRHQRNFTIEKEKEFNDKRKRSPERTKRQTEKRSVCSATQTCDLLQRGRPQSPKSGSNDTSNGCSQRQRTETQIISKYDFEKNDSCKKTIENFQTIREICDQMIGYFSEKQKLSTNMSPKDRALSLKTIECLASKIKKEN